MTLNIIWDLLPGLRTLIHFNVVLAVFHLDPIFPGVCKTVRTTFQFDFFLQSQAEGPENLSQICPIVMCLFRTFSPRLENNDTLKYSSDSFAHTLIYVVNVENCQNNIEMNQSPPIAGRRSQIVFNVMHSGSQSITYCTVFASVPDFTIFL